MKKREKRVSFALPPEEEAKVEQDPAIHISVSDDAAFDEEFETAGSSSSDDERSAAVYEDPGESDYDENETLKTQPISRRVRLRDKYSDEEKDLSLDVDGREISSSSERGSGSKDPDDLAHSEPVSLSESELGSESEPESEPESGSVSGSVSGSEYESESDSEEEDGTPRKAGAKEAPPSVQTFGEMNLDPRLERSIDRMGWRKPTPVQSAVIPAALKGRDVLVNAPTGSGKTAAYVIPILQHLRKKPSSEGGVRAVVLVPTRELVHQGASVFKQLSKYYDGLHVAAMTSGKGKGDGQRRRRGDINEEEKQGVAFSRAADVIIGTPASIASAFGGDEKNDLTTVEFVVVDEADLVLSYGHENDARSALAKIPTTAQAMLLSATLEAEGMDSFRKVVLRRPLTIKVTTDADMEDGDPTGASHNYARLKNHRDRYLVVYVMLRLNVISGKVLIFVKHINAAFRLKLFLDQFKVKSAVLNSELPANSRIHCVEQFNAGVFDILIATDESKAGISSSQKEKERTRRKGEKKRRRPEKDAEFGLSRGIDFRNVAAVMNFDVPETVPSYAHRAGRTARAGKSGTVLSLACSGKEEKLVGNMAKDLGVVVNPLAFRMDQIEAFRYRVEDSLRMVTDAAVNGARLADVRREIVNSETLKDYFEDNPQDMDALQHNLRLAKSIPEHLAHVPSYLLPPGLRKTVSAEPHGRKFRSKRHRDPGRRASKAQKMRADPLRSFTANGVSGSSRQRYQAKHGIKRKSSDPGRTMRPRKRRNF